MSTSTFSDVPLRVKSWVYILLVFGAMLLHSSLMSALVIAISMYALKEYLGIHIQNYKFPLYSIWILAIPAFISVILNRYDLFLVSIGVEVIGIVLLRTFLFKGEITVSVLIKASLLCIFSIGHLAFIRAFNKPSLQIVGIQLVLYLVVVTELNDVFQYLSGKTMGKRKIVPTISPNKTLEGLLGGILLSICLSNLIGPLLLPHLSIVGYSIAGALISLIGFGGDIFISAVKRKVQVKDMGDLIPGHGGLLDRMDSLLFVLPLAYWIILLVDSY